MSSLSVNGTTTATTIVATLGTTVGASFIGCVLAAVLYGISNLQTYLYYITYPEDWIVHKYSVGLLWVLDTFHVVLTIIAVYHYLIDSFGNFLALTRVTWSYKLQIAINVVIVLLVQGLYALRVWRFGSHYSRVWPIIVTIAFLTGLAIGIILAVKTYQIRTFADLLPMTWVVYASFISATIVDVVIAVSMCYYLLRSKSGFSRTNNMIVTIIRMTLASGSLTSACSLAALISYAVMPHNLVFLGIEFLLTKLYVNSYLAMLNARVHARSKESTTENSVSLSRIVNIRTTTTSHVVTSSPYAGDDKDIQLTSISGYNEQPYSKPTLDAFSGGESKPRSGEGVGFGHQKIHSEAEKAVRSV